MRIAKKKKKEKKIPEFIAPRSCSKFPSVSLNEKKSVDFPDEFFILTQKSLRVTRKTRVHLFIYLVGLCRFKKKKEKEERLSNIKERKKGANCRHRISFHRSLFSFALMIVRCALKNFNCSETRKLSILSFFLFLSFFK